MWYRSRGVVQPAPGVPSDRRGAQLVRFDVRGRSAQVHPPQVRLAAAGPVIRELHQGEVRALPGLVLEPADTQETGEQGFPIMGDGSRNSCFFWYLLEQLRLISTHHDAPRRWSRLRVLQSFPLQVNLKSFQSLYTSTSSYTSASDSRTVSVAGAIIIRTTTPAAVSFKPISTPAH